MGWLRSRTRKYGISARRGLLRLDIGRPDHLAPLLGIVCDALFEFGGGASERYSSELGKPRLDRGVSKACIEFFIQLVDDLGGRVLGCPEAKPVACFKARCGLAHGRDVR